MRPRALAALIGAIGLVLWACDPDLPTRACESTDDCFAGETCSAGQCVTAGAPSQPDGDTPDQRPLPEFGLTDRGVAPDAVVDLGADLGGSDAALGDLGPDDLGLEDSGLDLGMDDLGLEDGSLDMDALDGALDMSPDMALPDMALPDMAPPDMAAPDMAPPDMAPPDMAPLPVDAGEPDHEGLDLPDTAVPA